jgi:RimJ/RimL family protein N-acetyltransferase
MLVHSSVVLLTLEDRVLKTVVGVCEVSASTDARIVVQIAFTTERRHRRTGYMKEALTALLEFLSNTGSSMVIEASVDLKNVAAVGYWKDWGCARICPAERLCLGWVSDAASASSSFRHGV